MTDSDDERFMREALGEAKDALARGDRPVGCVIVHRDKIVARGSNHEFTKKSKSEHAETSTLRSCAEYLFEHGDDCVIYTTVEPCVMCLGSIVMANIRRVVFGAGDPERGGTQMYEQVEYVRRSLRNGYVGGVLGDESQRLQHAFSESGSPSSVDAPLLQKIDCLMLNVADLDAALSFYRDRLGLPLAWRTETGLAFRVGESELVLNKGEPTEPETDIMVASAEGAARRFAEAGGSIVTGPFDIKIGQCVVVADPWGNKLVLLDSTKGLLNTDADGFVVG
ncbi:MAG: VOC family protein [Phycisphaerae bacterium]|nr:VOC family protein [Phycisphaerae bacterium]